MGPITRTFVACMLIVPLLAAVLVLRRCDLRPDSESAPSEHPPKIVGWRVVEDFPEELALFETVFWEPRDTTTLRALLREKPLVQDKTVLEIGTGSGLISLCCLKAGARRVVATDVNVAAVANAAYNADLLGVTERFETRWVPLGDCEAYCVLGPTERFDVIISNPPWEDAKPASIDQFALYDERFQLLRSILVDLDERLTPGGKAYLAYGSVSSVRQTLCIASELGLSATVLDDRDLNTLSEVFLPAIVIEVTLVAPSENAAEGDETMRFAADDPEV